MSKRYRYPRAIIVKEKDGTKVNIITQLYKVGLYVAYYINTEPLPLQSCTTPSAFARNIKKDIKKAEERGAKVILGSEITTEKINGFWEETN